MKKLKILFVLFFFSVSAKAAVLSNSQMDQVECASVKMQLLYYYLSPNRKPSITDHSFKCAGNNVRYIMPKWFDEVLPNMTAKKVWRDPEEGEISEAQLWQVSISVLFEFLEVTKKTFPPEKGGAGIQPALLVKEYSDIKIRYQMSLDRLYRARVMGDSFNGRGRTMLAIMNLILKEMESIADSISSSNSKQYAQAVTAISVLAQDNFSVVLRPPRIYAPPEKESSFAKVLRNIFSLVGIILIFFAVQLFFALNFDQNSKMMNDYRNKLEVWKEAFSRQFLDIKIQYLIFTPMVVFGILGLMTMNILIFFFLLIVGVMLGFRMPNIYLNFMKFQRGRKVDAQLMDALILMSNALKSGLDIVQGFEMVSKDLLPPISDEFALVIKNYQLGMPFEKALGVMEERVASKMLSYMVRAIVLQRQIGGNLTKVFERIVLDIREESKLDQKTKALTAQQKIQAIVVAIVPFILVSVMFMFQPEMMINFYTSGPGIAVITVALMLMGMGMKMVSSLGKIRV
ncbi:MAG: type II secretion system F family protein [Elusimicrobiota bacterium]